MATTLITGTSTAIGYAAAVLVLNVSTAVWSGGASSQAGQHPVSPAFVRATVESLMTVHAGECFGEMAIVDAEPRSADVHAVNDATLLEVNAEIIKNVNDVLALKIYRKLAIIVTQKLRAYTEHHEDTE